MGISNTNNVCIGDGDWTGDFDQGSASYGLFQVGAFWTPDTPEWENGNSNGYFGISSGGALGFPGVGFARPTYHSIFETGRFWDGWFDVFNF
jgi:hypothetical protein